MPTDNASLMKKRVLIKGLLVVSSIVLLVVVGALVILQYTGSDNHGEMSSIPDETMGTQTHVNPPYNSEDLTGKQPEVQGGVIRFNPAGGEFANNITVKLDIETPLKSGRGDLILADIYYTRDGAEPSKTKGQKYTPGEQIPITIQGKTTIKARLISKLGNNYMGKVNSQSYSLQKQALPPAINAAEKNAVTTFQLLDQQTREEIIEKMNRVVIEVEGITRINRTGHLKLLLSISKAGQARLSNISGFDVNPASKLADIKSQLDQKIRRISLAAPTRNGKPVDVRAWVGFNQIATFYEKVIVEGIGQ